MRRTAFGIGKVAPASSSEVIALTAIKSHKRGSRRRLWAPWQRYAAGECGWGPQAWRFGEPAAIATGQPARALRLSTQPPSTVGSGDEELCRAAATRRN